MRVIPIATFFMALFSFAAADAATHRHPKHGSSSQVAALTSESINGAAPQGARSDPAIIVKTEVLLDRDGFSPGEFDGKTGDECLDRQAKRLARACACRRGYSPERTRT